VKNYEIATYSTTHDARYKISAVWEAIEFDNILKYIYLNLKTIKFYLI
jgi:hypothetical protein